MFAFAGAFCIILVFVVISYRLEQLSFCTVVPKTAVAADQNDLGLQGRCSPRSLILGFQIILLQGSKDSL